ncbi:hypothetical protein R1T08_02335 [Streptomyces sp. SBC-4]|nr:hypothetical protein [Streptomyces sp. SBC-4]MDV5143175.1 hypothetical protein [Streptomyces sp. SBC-4]
MHDRRDQDQETGNAAPKHRAPAAESATEAEAVVFVCTTCEVPLTGPLTRLPAVPELPYYAWWDAEEPGPSPPTVPSGRYAVETEPYGAPLVVSEVPAEAMPRYGTISDEHGQYLVSQGPRGNIVINPDDAHGLEYHHASSACCGATPTGGLNQRCACGTLVATLCSDCCCPYELHLSADHVRAVLP